MAYIEFAKSILQLNVAACFGIPGGGPSLDLLNSLENVGIPFYLSHFEGSGAIMAATIGRLSSTAGLSISIKGPGLTNALPGIAVAWFEAFPLVHIAESTPVSAPPSVAHKRLPQRQLCSVVTKANGYLSSEGGEIVEAVNIATSEEPGPVLLELGSGPHLGRPEASSFGDLEKQLSDLWKSLRKCHRPIIIAGAYAVRQGFASVLSTMSVPIFTTVAAKGIIDESKDNAAGIFTGVEEELTPEWNLLPKSDLILSLGLSAREVLRAKPFSCPSIHIGSHQTVGIEGFNFQWILGKEYLPEIFSILSEKAWGTDILTTTKNRLKEKLEDGFLPGRIFNIVERHFSRNVRLVVDTGFFCTVGEHVWSAKRPDWFLASSQSRYMGTCLPMALGAAIYDRSVPTVAVMGDGGIGMYLADIKLAVEHKLPILAILMSDDGFGSIRPRARKIGCSLRPIKTDGKSWVSVLSGFGVPGTRVENEQEFEHILNAWDPSTGSAFVEVKFDPDSYEKMTMGIRT